MAILINDNYSLQANKPFDARYMNISTPWVDVPAVLAGIPTYRYIGLTVNIAGSEWWWKNGVGDGDLVLKSLGGTISGATNGLHLANSGTVIQLGGALNQDTIISGATNTYGISFTSLKNFNVGFNNVSTITDSGNTGGLRYGGNYSSYYVARSIPDVAFVTGYTQSKTNHVNVRIVTANGYTITDSDDFIGISGATSISLPASPVCGHRVSISDISGNAVVNVITISGNGKNIIGSPNATINTDYGSFTLVWTAQNSIGWSSIAMNN